jgi:hypothetical protein
LASFLGPSCRRVSSRRIFFLRVFSFIIRPVTPQPHHEAMENSFRVKSGNPRMSRHCCPSLAAREGERA